MSFETLEIIDPYFVSILEFSFHCQLKAIKFVFYRGKEENKQYDKNSVRFRDTYKISKRNTK